MPKNSITQRLALTLIATLTLVGASLAQTEVTIKPATVTVVVDGKTLEVYSHALTVSDFLKEQEIKLGRTDRVTLTADTRIVDGISLEIQRNVVPAPVKTVEAKRIARKVVKAESAPKEIRKVTRTASKLASRGISGRSVRSFTMVATAYSNLGNGKWGSQTATGATCRRGIVAVDPRVIPMGTRLYVEGYGECVALDTGGAIKGMRIDLFMDRESECNRWGRRRVTVHVLGR